MSTTTISVSTLVLAVPVIAALEGIRRLEAASREMDRRRKIGKANKAISEQEERFQKAVSRLDDAVRRLPDLKLRTPKLPAISSNESQGPEMLESYVKRLTEEVNRFEAQLDASIAEAERILDRRVKKAATWRAATDLEQQCKILEQRCRDLAPHAGEVFTVPRIGKRPHEDAELEEVESYLSVLREMHEGLRRGHDALRKRVASLESAMALAGKELKTGAAEDALSRHQTEKKARAITELQAHRDKELCRNGLSLDDLSDSLRDQIAWAMEQAHRNDYREDISRWISREKQRRRDVARALDLLGTPPVLLHEDAGLTRRWESLAQKLQRIAGGLDDLTTSVEREYEQLKNDALLMVNTGLARADWISAMYAEGFEVFENGDGKGLVVVDLDHPETWLDVTPLKAEGGGFGAIIEMKTDAKALPDEAKVTDAICAKLKRAAVSALPEVSTKAEEVDRKTRIERARRPKALAQRL